MLGQTIWSLKRAERWHPLYLCETIWISIGPQLEYIAIQTLKNGKQHVSSNSGKDIRFNFGKYWATKALRRVTKTDCS